MGKTTLVDHTNATACCEMSGVACSGSTVTKLNWNRKRLRDSIPDDIEKLVNLKELRLSKNYLTGKIPKEIKSLTQLRWLDLSENRLDDKIPKAISQLEFLERLDVSNNLLTGDAPETESMKYLRLLDLSNNVGLDGFTTPKCSARVFAGGTGVIICGCSSSRSPASLFPPPKTRAASLYPSDDSTSKEKRAFVFSTGIQRVTCNVDDLGNPYQDCMNALFVICHPDELEKDSTRISLCKSAVNQVTASMNTYWSKFRRQCGQWKSTDGYIGDAKSWYCYWAALALQNNAYYQKPDGQKINVSSMMTDSIIYGLFLNKYLKEF